MSQPELLKKIAGFLDSVGVDYFLTGSLASSLQGEPRSTHDIDLVVRLKQGDVRALREAFGPPDYYVDLTEADFERERIDMFNLIDVKNGDKIDFWLYASDDFDRSRFSRRYRENFAGVPLYVSSPEDTILAKLRWSKMSGGSKKQLLDALRVFEVQREAIDQEYLQRWIDTLELKDEWKALEALSP